MVKKYIKIKCNLCHKHAVYVPAKNKDIEVVCLMCGGKTKKTVKKTVKTIRTASSNYANVKKGKRLDIHPTYSFRSATEANFARILQYLKQDFKFEERVFTFDGYKNRPFLYIPDFELTKNSKKFPKGWYEIKGWMDTKSRQKLKRFKKHYPEEASNLTVIVYRKSDRAATEFCKKLGVKILFWDQLSKEYKLLIPKWE